MYCKKCGKYSGRYPLCSDCYYEENYQTQNFCEICGEDSGEYPLCKTCYYKVKEYAEENFFDYFDYDEEDEFEDIYETYSPGICVACSKPKEHSEFFFCSDCFKKYRNKELILSVIKAKEIKVLESRYYNKFKCADGHFVKSKSEREIDNFFDKYNIRHYYEPELTLNNETIHPDFFLPDLNVYIEHWGMDDKQYKQTIQYKIEIYKKLNVTLICTYENEDIIDLENTLKRKLKSFVPGQINFLK